MTRFFAMLSCLLLLLGLCVGATAAQTDATQASSVNIFATVSSDGACDVTTNVTVHVDTPKKDLAYPVPLSASNVTLNGKPVLTEKTNQARMVDLSRVIGSMTGDFSFTVSYTIASVVHPLETTDSTTIPEDATSGPKRLQLALPMLAGFAYPINDLQFSINLPGTITQTPRFNSGYHQANIEKDLTYSTSGSNVAGRSWNAIKDHETLIMYLDTTDEMFPQTRAELPEVEQVMPLIGICSGIALAFWIFFLPNFLPLRSFHAVPPEGYGAGQIGTILTRAGTDLNLMVFSWAQLGYVTLRLDRRGHVFVYKRMDMGNERTMFEQKCFYQLFSRRDMLDTSSGAYQKLLQSVANQKSAPQLFRTKRSGVKIFRVIVAIAGLLSGTCFGILLGNMLDYGWVFTLILSAVGLFCSWHIQTWAEGLFLHHSPQLWIAIALSILWLFLGLAIAQFPLALLAVFIQIAGGFLATFGGRRTEEGRNAMGQSLALRRYMAKLTPHQAQLLCRDNPEAFFDLAPYAIALGCDNTFASKFGKSRLPVCPYIQASSTRGLTARQWSQLMRYMLANMSTLQRKSPLESVRSVTRNFMK